MVKSLPFVRVVRWQPFYSLVRNSVKGLRDRHMETGICRVKPDHAPPATHQVGVPCAATDSLSPDLILAWWILRPLRFLHSLSQIHFILVVCLPFRVDDIKSILLGSPVDIDPMVDLSLNWVPLTGRYYLEC